MYIARGWQYPRYQCIFHFYHHKPWYQWYCIFNWCTSWYSGESFTITIFHFPLHSTHSNTVPTLSDSEIEHAILSLHVYPPLYPPPPPTLSASQQTCGVFICFFGCCWLEVDVPRGSSSSICLSNWQPHQRGWALLSYKTKCWIIDEPLYLMYRDGMVPFN